MRPNLTDLRWRRGARELRLLMSSEEQAELRKRRFFGSQPREEEHFEENGLGRDMGAWPFFLSHFRLWRVRQRLTFISISACGVFAIG